MIRKHKLFRRPKQIFDTVRIKEEDAIVAKYGLKNKREIWKAKAKLDKIREKAKKLIDASIEDQEKFLGNLVKEGFKVKDSLDILALTEEDILSRRLQTIVFKLGLAHTPKEARQLITHKKVSVNGKVVNIPSYPVKVNEENKISLIKLRKEKKIKEVEK
jgi:small subunit ribosomal protein S4